jgi:putative ABC transport system permease protein
MPKRTWLRSYFTDPELPFDYEADAFSIRRPGPSAEGEVRLLERPGVVIGLRPSPYRANRPTTRARRAVAVVPTNLLAYLAGARAGTVVYDPEVRLFVPLPEEPVYDKARLYARGIDDIPQVVRSLQKRRFAVMSEGARITEIQHQDHSLRVLIAIVGLGVFLFGVLVVVSVLIDSTDRRRGTIGILRVMGVSGPGIFYLVLVRATVIGVMAGALSVGFGVLIALGLGWPPPPGSWPSAWKPVVRLIIDRDAVVTVLAGALACCAVGALIPAWRASRLDPFDAIVEGRFR